MTKDVYVRHGYADREEYLESLAQDFGVDDDIVGNLADMLGPNEDFDGLVSALEDMQVV